MFFWFLGGGCGEGVFEGLIFSVRGVSCCIYEIKGDGVVKNELS